MYFCSLFLTALTTTLPAAPRDAAQPLSAFPVSFEANRGQAAGAVQFFSRCASYTVYLTESEMVFALREGGAPATVRIELVGAKLGQGEGQSKSQRTSHYFIGEDPARWITDVPHFTRVVYRGVYPGVDLALHGASNGAANGAIEYDLVLAPGADPERIALRFTGADSIEIDEDGDLLIHAGCGVLRQQRPSVYQESSGARRPIRGGYELHDGREARFHVGPRDASLPLVIDPILVYSTFLGTPAAEGISDITVDAFGSAYVTGFTRSPDFPVKTPLQPDQGVADQITAFVTKLSPTGRDIVYSTYLGGTGMSWGEGIAVDVQGQAIIAGWTDAADFPLKKPVRPGPAGGADVFVTRLSASGNALVHSTLFGGAGDDRALDLAVDVAGEILITGETLSANFPAIHGRDASLGGTKDAFVLKLNAAGDAVVYSTYLGGSGKETARGIAADFDGNAYVAGETDSTDFPLKGAFQGMLKGTRDAFVTKLSADGSTLVYSTYLGGDGGDDAWAIAVDGLNDAYISGRASGGFPLKGSLFPALGSTLLFLTKLQPDGADTVYSTLLGSNVTGIPEGIAIGSFGDVFVTGWAAYFGDGFSQFPKRGPPLQDAFGGGTGDVFLLRLDSTGGFFRFASFLGGTQGEEATRIALGDGDEAYIAGMAFGADFPTTLGAFDRMLAGQNDGFIARVNTQTYPDDPPYLTLGVDKTAVLTSGDRQKRFRVVVPPGLRAVISVTDADPGDWNALYVQYNSPAEPYLFDQASDERGRSDQRIVIPATQTGECHILVQANRVNGPSSDVTVRADAFDIALESLAPRHAASGTSFSASVHGGGFGPETTFTLERSAGGTSIAATAIRVVSSERAEMTFKLVGASTGIYRLRADEPGGESAVLDDAFDVIKSNVPGIFQASLSSPDSCRLSRHARMTLEYENAGDAEIPARILRLTAPSSVEMRVEGEKDFQKGIVQVLAVNPDGPADRLPPGAAGSISVEFRGNVEGTIEIQLDALAPNRGDFIDWDTLAPPAGFTPAAWTSIWPPLSVAFGASWLDYEASLGRIAARFERRGLSGAPVTSVRQLFRAALMQVNGEFPGSAVAGQAIRSPTNSPLASKTVLALEGGQVRSSAVTDSRGFFTLQCLEPGTTYKLAMVFHDTANAEVTLPATGEDVLGFELRAIPRSNSLRAADSSCDAYTLPGGPLVFPKGFATRIASRKVRIVKASDPNEKDGPDGEGPKKLIGVRDEVLYTIYFENVRTASAAAQQVLVTDQLDPDLDWGTFRMREFGVGEHLVSLDTSGATSSTLVRDGYSGTQTESGITLTSRYSGVEVRCDFNPVTGFAEWLFATVDPNTGDRPPLFVNAGFLPPNTQPPAGEGWVSFTVFPKQNLTEATEIKNESSIQFDNLPPQSTQPVTNVISLSLFTLATPSNPFPADDVSHFVEVDGLYLSWDGDPRTDAYDIWFWKEGEAIPIRPTASGLTVPFYVPTRKVERGAVYHWQVVANAFKQTRKGPQWSFRTVDAEPLTPGIPQPSSPQQGATGVELTPELDWKPTARADVYEVALWPHGASPTPLPIVSGIAGTSFRITDALDRGVRYDWQVMAINRSGRTTSSVVTFTTNAPPGGVFKRGDANGDGKPDISDASYILGYLFLGNPRTLLCEKSADTNDDGKVNISDPTALLGHLFLGTTPALPPPFEQCGTDPTQDTLTCGSFPPCP